VRGVTVVRIQSVGESATAHVRSGSDPSLVASRVDWLSDLIRAQIVLWNGVDARLRVEHGLSLAFFESLYFTSQAPGGSLRVGDLAAELRVTVGGTSKLVDRIVAAGLLVRTVDPDDRRAARVSLTPSGERALRAATGTYEDEVAAFLDLVLDAGEQEQMHGFVRRLLDAAGDGDEQ
jgi:DNA-binding MarR family transcriptional regulator